PDIMMHGLEMPDPLACIGIERNEAIRKEIGALSVGSVEVVRSRTGRHKCDPPFFIDRQARPVVGAADKPVCRGVLPGVMAIFAWMWYRMEDPFLLPCIDVECPDMARCCGERLSHHRPHDQEVFVPGN